jgi:hypothetical protein
MFTGFRDSSLCLNKSKHAVPSNMSLVYAPEPFEIDLTISYIFDVSGPALSARVAEFDLNWVPSKAICPFFDIFLVILLFSVSSKIHIIELRLESLNLLPTDS